MKGTANIKYVFAIELRDTGKNGFNLSTSEIIPTGLEALYAVSELTKNIITKSNGVTQFSIKTVQEHVFSIFVFVKIFLNNMRNM